MKSLIRISISLAVLAAVVFSVSSPSRADEPQPQSPADPSAQRKVYLPLVQKPVGPALLPNGSFESGNTVWTTYSSQNVTVIRQGFAPNSALPHSGAWGAWLGGLYSATVYIQQQVTVNAGTPYLAYWHWIASNDVCGYDFAHVKVNGVAVATYNLCDATRTNGWVKKVVNLSAFAGQSVALRIEVNTDYSLNSNLFVDDVMFQPTAALAEDLTVTASAGDPIEAAISISGENDYGAPKQ